MVRNTLFIVLITIIILVVSGCKGGGSSSGSIACKDDSCFENAVKACSKATYTKTDNGNTYSYAVNGVQGNNCNIMIKVDKASSDTPPELAKLLVGKSMTCNIPKGTYDAGVIDLGELDSCSGPLKDGMNAFVQQIAGSFG